MIIYKDKNANAIFVRNNNGAQFMNSLHAELNDVNPNNVNIFNLVTENYLSVNTPYTEILDDNTVTYGATASDVVDSLNTLFSDSGTDGTDLPIITSPLSISVTTGDVVNYELVATYGVGYEWLGLPSGVVVTNGNYRKIIGTPTVGVYNVTIKAINYNGTTTETLVITVSNPPYSSTKSIQFDFQKYLDASANTSNPLYRPNNGTGANDSNSLLFWFKAGTNNNQQQTILFFGGSDLNNEGRYHLTYNGNNSNEKLTLRIGTNNNWIQWSTPVNSIVPNTWQQILIAYNGGQTGSSSGDLTSYNYTMRMSINGVYKTLSTSHNNFGWSGSIVNDFFRIGRKGSGGNYMRNNCRVDLIALFDSDQFANRFTMYNGGVSQDLTLLSTPPVHLWEMGDGDTFPTLIDRINGLNFTQQGMVSSDTVTDAP